MTGWSWVEDAACTGMDTNLFFPGIGQRPDPAVIAVCNGCPVKTECATAGTTEYGVWGGLSEKQRRRTHGYGRRPDAPRRAGVVGIGMYTTEPVTGSMRRLQALARLGYGMNELADLIRHRSGHYITHSGVAVIRDGAQDFTTPERADAIEDVYDHLVGLGRTSTSARADVNIRQAAAKGYAHPKDWAGLDIDNPTTRPRTWRPTG